MNQINSHFSGHFLQEALFEVVVGALVLAASVHGVVSLHLLPV